MGIKSIVRAASAHRHRGGGEADGGGGGGGSFAAASDAGARKPQLDGDADWEISDSAKMFDMASAEFGKFELTRLDPRANCCNAVIAMFVNSLKFQLMRLARVIELARSNKQYVTLDRVNTMYDWIEELESKRFIPILDCLRDDVLPELSRLVVIHEGSCLFVESRDKTFQDLKVALRNIVATSNAMTPRLPAGERVYVLIYRYVQFETLLLQLLAQVENLSNLQRKPTRAVEKHIVKLERYMFDVLSYTAGTVPVPNGGVTYDEASAQAMRGVMTAWMTKQQIKDMRSRLGIHFFNRRKAKALKEAKKDYRASTEGEFVSDFEASLRPTENAGNEVGKGERVDQELSRVLNQMHCMRLMEEVNGENMDLDGLTLEDPSGELVSSDDEETDGRVTLVFGNVYETPSVEDLSGSLGLSSPQSATT